MSKKLIEWMEIDKSRARKWILVILTYGYMILLIIVLGLSSLNENTSSFDTVLYSYTSIYSVMIGFYCSTKPKEVSDIKDEKDKFSR